MEQNQELRQAWDFVEHTGRSIFLTGKAGTGKTTFLRTVVERSTKRLVVVAPTGVAAINAGGVTIHSFFQLPLSPYVPDSQFKSKFDFGREKRKIISSLDLLIIDEISMVRSDLLDAIDAVLRRFRDRYKPFGGVQLLMIGDLQQLTPVVTPEDERILAPHYDTPYFFGSKALAQIDYVTIQLERVYRQQDPTFVNLLNHVREGRPTPDDIAMLNSRYNPRFAPRPDEGYIRLTTHNHTADFYNRTELDRLTRRAFTFTARIEGTFPDYAYPTALQLTLKQDAQVMFIKNDPQGRYYNGRIGRVTYVDSHRILVLCQGDTEAIDVTPDVWENAKYSLNPTTREIQSEVQGTFTQMPLRLAWAITIHKSQGLTFSHAIIDALSSFAPGQVYVALSRCQTLEGMVLATPIEPRSIINDERVDSYIAHQEEAARISISQLPTLKEEYYRHLLLELFDFRQILYKEEYLGRVLNEYFYRSHNDVTQLHKRTLEALRQQVMSVADKWTQKMQQMTTAELHDQAFLERVRRSAAYFEEQLDTVLTRPIALTAAVQTNNKQAMTRLNDIRAELQQAVTTARRLLASIADHGFTIGYYLKQRQLSVLDAMDELNPNKKAKTTRKAKAPKAPKPEKEKTWETTLKLYKQGMTPQQIASERQLTTGTIFNHLARYLDTGEVALPNIIDGQHHQAILKILGMVGTDENITAVKALCPPDVTYDEIRLVMNNAKKKS